MEYVIKSIELKMLDGENQETWTIEEIYNFVKEEIEILEIGESKINIAVKIPIKQGNYLIECLSEIGEIKELNGEIIFEAELYHFKEHKIYPKNTKCFVKGTHITITKIG